MNIYTNTILISAIAGIVIGFFLGALCLIYKIEKEKIK